MSGFSFRNLIGSDQNFDLGSSSKNLSCTNCRDKLPVFFPSHPGCCFASRDQVVDLETLAKDRVSTPAVVLSFPSLVGDGDVGSGDIDCDGW